MRILAVRHLVDQSEDPKAVIERGQTVRIPIQWLLPDEGSAGSDLISPGNWGENPCRVRSLKREGFPPTSGGDQSDLSTRRSLSILRRGGRDGPARAPGRRPPALSGRAGEMA